jgi:hypothetical protein
VIVKKTLAVVVCLLALSIWAEAQEEPEPKEPPTTEAQEGEGESEGPSTYKEQYEEFQKQAKKTIKYRWFVGGAFGFAAGSETAYAEVSPIFGYRVSQLFQIGGSLTFRYRKDKRYEPDLSTIDQGGSIVGRLFVYDPIFLQAEVERLNWDYLALVDDTVTVVEDTYTGYYAGFGFVQRASDRVAMYMAFLYDFAYDDNEPSPNTRPFLVRIGFGFAF